MTIMQTIILGIVQGLSEFLPISSSGHLIIVPFFFQWQIPKNEAFVFDVLVQVATLAAVFTYFWHDLVDIAFSMIEGLKHKTLYYNMQARLGWYIIVATIPAGIVGIAIKPIVEMTFGSPLVVGIGFIITSIFLTIAEKKGRQQRVIETMTLKDALWMGLLQALAILPGISRSGSTIAAGVFNGLQRSAAARFSFLMSVPVMIAAGALEIFDLFSIPNVNHILLVFIPGFVIAALVGYLSIRWLLRFLIHRSLYPFSIYCFLMGVITIVTFLLMKTA